MPSPPEPVDLDRLLQLSTIALITWLVLAVIGAFTKFIKLRHRIDVADNREARRIHTQMTVIGRTLQVVVIIIGLAVALMTFPRVQQIGTSLLASAGIAGLAIGLAARPVRRPAGVAGLRGRGDRDPWTGSSPAPALAKGRAGERPPRRRVLPGGP